LLSTIDRLAECFAMSAASMRATVSRMPPGATGTTSVTGFTGNAVTWATTACGLTPAMSAATDRTMVLLHGPSTGLPPLYVILPAHELHPQLIVTLTAIVGATVVHPDREGNAAVARNTTIIVEGTRIRAVGPRRHDADPRWRHAHRREGQVGDSRPRRFARALSSSRATSTRGRTSPTSTRGCRTSAR
jgi:hypothetical protein